MSGAPAPQILLEPIAADADPSNINTIPDAPPGGNRASVRLGFPPATMESILSGGEPPLGQDVNGFLNLITSHTYWLQAGQQYGFASTLSTAMTGYAVGAVVAMADVAGQWRNLTAGNTSNPDTSATTSGWVPQNVYGSTSIGVTTGTFTLTALQARFPILVITGALTANVTLRLPTWIYQWLIVNSTTGAHTLTIASSGGGANSVVVPQGGPASPVGVYSIGDNNLYPVITPLTVAIAQAPTPLTLVERDNNGNLFGNYFNGGTPLEVPALTGGSGKAAVIVQNAAGDGYFRKISIANFLAAALGFNAAIAQNGYIQFLGLTIQWGFASGGENIAVTFPIAFPVAFFTGYCNTANRNFMGGQGTNFISSPTRTGMVITVDPTPGQGYWLAIGH